MHTHCRTVYTVRVLHVHWGSQAHYFHSNEDHTAHEEEEDSAVHTDVVEQVLRVSRDGVKERDLWEDVRLGDRKETVPVHCDPAYLPAPSPLSYIVMSLERLSSVEK